MSRPAKGGPWWRDAVVYEIYVRSFTDANGEGEGDLEGVRRRLPYLERLGVDAIWLTPFYRSPLADGGYDVADYREVDPRFGTISDLEELIGDAHRHGIRVIVDIVPNHTSDQHPWFRAALKDPAARRRYIFREGRGGAGDMPPNDWESTFGGPAWTRVADGEWYLHLFAPEQPDLNWRDPEVQNEFCDILRFWLDRGVDGFRIDVAMGLFKDESLPDLGPRTVGGGFVSGGPIWGLPEVHGVYRDWRRILDSYPGERMAIGEVWTDTPEDLALYLRPDELQQAFNFQLQLAPWSAADFRRVAEHSLSAMAPVEAVPTWVLSSHDAVRHVTRYTDPARPGSGLARARAALLFMLALPGSAYLYQGEELGLPEVTDLPDEARQDPIWRRSGGTVPGRDGCRVPIPWSGTHPPYGFSSGDTRTWLPMPKGWEALTAEAQEGEPGSTLAYYRQALRLRRELRGSLPGAVEWLDAPPGALFFRRGLLTCAINFGEEPLRLPPHDDVLIASSALHGARLPGDAAAWLR